MIGISIVRPVLERFDNSDNQIIYTVIAVAAAVIITAVLAKKYGIALKGVSYEKFCVIALPCFAAYIYIAYMFIGCKEYMNFYDFGSFHNILVTISYVLILVWSAVRIKKLNAE